MKTQLKLWETYLSRHNNMPKTGSKAAWLQEEMPHFCAAGSPSWPANLAETDELFAQHPLTAGTARCPRDPGPARAQQLDRSGWTEGHFSRAAGVPAHCTPQQSRSPGMQRGGAEPRFRALSKASSSHLNHGMLLRGSGGKDSPLMINQARKAQRPPVR